MKAEHAPTPTESVSALKHQYKSDWLTERDTRLWAAIDEASPGDYWHECLTPICVVISRTNTHIVFCDNVVRVNDDRWTWGVDVLKILPRELFFQKVQYSRCEPKCHVWASEAIIGKPKRRTSLFDLYVFKAIYRILGNWQRVTR